MKILRINRTKSKTKVVIESKGDFHAFFLDKFISGNFRAEKGGIFITLKNDNDTEIEKAFNYVGGGCAIFNTQAKADEFIK